MYHHQHKQHHHKRKVTKWSEHPPTAASSANVTLLPLQFPHSHFPLTFGRPRPAAHTLTSPS